MRTASRSNLLLVTALAIAVALSFFGGRSGQAVGDCVDKGSNDLYVDKDSLCGACSDGYTRAQNSVTQPWCTIARAHTGAAGEKVAPGYTLYVQDGEYGEEKNFTVTGTVGNPITYKALGNSVVMGVWSDVDDDAMTKTSGRTNIYETPWNVAFTGGDFPSRVTAYQTFYDDVVVDDPGNDSKFTFTQSNGPLPYTYFASLDSVDTTEGSWTIISNVFYVHPFDERDPSDATTDIRVGYRGWSMSIETNISYLVFDGFKVRYAGASNFVAQGANNQFKNMWYNINVEARGSYNTWDNVSVTHTYSRNGTNDWWTNAGGSGFAFGDNVAYNHNTLTNSDIFYNWNNVSMGAGSDHTISNTKIHGSANHCMLPSKTTNATFQNLQVYNCQDDIFYLGGGVTGALYENITTFGDPLFTETDGANGTITFRNVIFNGCTVDMGAPNVSCAFEGTTTIENSIFLCDPGQQITIEHCTTPGSATGTNYTLANYLAACALGAGGGGIDNCMTLSNLSLVTSNYTNVITGGRFTPDTDAWDYHIPNSSSIARNGGSSSTLTTRDLEGDLRPLGGAFDIGADEFDENADPILAAIGNKSVNETATLTIELTATDADHPASSLRYSATNGPSGSVLTDHLDGTATFTWTPARGTAGSYPNVQFSVTDGTTPDSETITITVSDASAPETVTDLRSS